MRRFTNGPASRNTARGVCVVFVLTFIMGPAALPAFAQEEVRYQAIPVAVLDFENVSDRADPLLGRKAADALAVALDPERFEVLERQKVQDTLDQLGMTLPLDKEAQMRLGRELKRGGVGVHGIITGEVRMARVRPGPQGVYGEVELALLMLDTGVGEFLNGALERVRSTSKPGYTGDDENLINEALATAADKAVRSMIDRRPAEAAVMTVTADTVLLGGGVRTGLYPGLKMVVVRFGEKVGIIELAKVEAQHSTARIIDNPRGIAQRDKASAMYELPKKATAQFAAPKTAEKRVKKAKGLWGVVAAVALLALAGGSNKKPPTSGVAAGVVATSLANAANLSPGASVGMTLVTWKGPSRGSEELLAYVIWRDGQLTWVERPTEGNFFIDPINMQLAPGESADYTATVQIGIDSGLVTNWTRDGTLVEPAAAPRPAAKSGLRAAMNAVRASIRQMALSWSIYAQDQTFEATWVATPAVAGFHHQYQISRVGKVRVLVPTGGEGGTTEGGTTEGGTVAAPPAMPPRARQLPEFTIEWQVRADSPLSAVGGPATPIVPPDLTAPINNARPPDPNAVAFNWITSDGADIYVLQISRDLQFRPENSVTIDALTGAILGGVGQTTVVDVASRFPGTGDQVLRWRIGARYSGDQAPPRLQQGVNRPQDAGFVWSLPQSFLLGVGAASPPAGERGFIRPRRASHGR